MALAGFKAQNHPQQTSKRGAKPEVDNLATTPEMFAPLHERFQFTIDVAALPHNTKCERFFTPEDDGLFQSWDGERVWCNPPYSNIEPWVQKAWWEWDHITEDDCPVFVPRRADLGSEGPRDLARKALGHA